MKLLAFCALLLLAACGAEPSADIPAFNPTPAAVEQSAAVPEWAKDATIYEVNIRQHTPDGTLAAFTQDLERIAELGSDILWLMPVYPISEARRKGPLGSYYAVSDFRRVNPEFGTESDLQTLVNRAHALGMRVILDFVPNHSGWDHHWITEHPEYYSQNEAGEIIDPSDPETGESYGWSDVADFNHDNPDLRAAMIDDLVYLVEEFDVDGFRMDVAYLVPDIFWRELMPRLRSTKPEIFMLAEAEESHFLNEELFSVNYAWSLHHLTNHIAQGDTSAQAIRAWYEDFAGDYEHGFQMHFLTNHDENSWNGTISERLGDNWRTMAVLTHTLGGMPLIYSGQEAGLDHRLRFFDKDTVSFADTSRYSFYRTLQSLKAENSALWNGGYGAGVEFLETGADAETTLAYHRAADGSGVLVLLNFGASSAEFVLPQVAAGRYTDVFNKEEVIIKEEGISLAGYDFRLLEWREDKD